MASTVNSTSDTDIRSRTHPWGINPIVHLQEIRQQLQLNKLFTLRQSFSHVPHLLSSAISSQHVPNHHLLPITDIADHLHQIEDRLSRIPDTNDDLHASTSLGKEVMMIITDLLLRVVHEIGRTNVRTPTFESILGYIRNLMHTRSAHMRQSVPGLLLISWYKVSSLMTSMQHESELRMTKKKVQELIDIAHDTCAWAYNHLTDESRDSDETNKNDL